jgi:hypothetical protein
MAFESRQEPNVAALDHFAFAFSPISTKRRDRLIHFHTLSPAIVALFALLLGLGFLRCDLHPSRLPRQPLGLDPLPVCMECLLNDLVLSHRLFGIDLAKCLTGIALRFGDWLPWFKLARCLCHFFTFSPNSTRRRMASARLRFPRHESNLAMNSSDRRNVRAGSRPVGFRPEPGRGPPCILGIAFSMSWYCHFQA